MNYVYCTLTTKNRQAFIVSDTPMKNRKAFIVSDTPLKNYKCEEGFPWSSCQSQETVHIFKIFSFAGYRNVCICVHDLGRVLNAGLRGVEQ